MQRSFAHRQRAARAKRCQRHRPGALLGSSGLPVAQSIIVPRGRRWVVLPSMMTTNS